MSASTSSPPGPMKRGQDGTSAMRVRALGLISAVVLLAVSAIVVVFAGLNRRTALDSLADQRDALVTTAVGTVELGLSTGQVAAVRGFLQDLTETPLVGGAVLYDRELRELVALPEGFALSEGLVDRVFDADGLIVGDLSYRSAALTEDDGSVLGHLVLAVSVADTRRRGRQALLVMVGAGLAVLLPVIALISWLLARLERALRSQEGQLRDAEREIEVLAERRRAHEERARLEEQLHHAQRMKTVGTLAGGIAHDFNNLLTPILGYVDLTLGDLPEESPLRPDLVLVRQCAARAKGLVSQILAFGRPQRQETVRCDLPELMEEVLRLLRSTIPSTIEIRASVDRACPSVLIDPTQLHQVLLNLCTNAAHAIGEETGSMTVTLSLTEVDERMARLNPDARPGPHACISVQDTGCGMDEDIAARVFEPFFTTREVGDGTGLGLSVAHGIITAHQGLFTVDSHVGEGTTMSLYLPIEERGAEGVPTTPLVLAPPIGGHILLMDGQPEVGELFGRMLDRLGYSAEVFDTGAEARKRFLEAPDTWDLLMLDQAMPDLTALEWARELKRTHPELPIVITTGFSDEVETELWNEADEWEILNKPASMGQLADAVSRALPAAAPV